MEGILLKEADTDHFCNFQNQFLVIWKYVSADQLYNFHQAAFLGKKIDNPVAVIHKLFIHMLSVPGPQIV